MILGVRSPTGGLLETLEEDIQKDRKKGLYFMRAPSVLGAVLDRFRKHTALFGEHFLRYSRHRLWEASGTSLEGFEFILVFTLESFCKFFCRCCETAKLQPLSSEIYVVFCAGPPL